MIILSYMDFGKKLKQVRLEKGLTQTELAKLSGVSQGVITNYERGFRTPTLEKAILLAKALKVPVEQFAEPVKSIKEKKRVHKNSRSGKIQELFEKLPPAKQENVFQLVKGLVS
jgi:transcriptional regulator with XRE-family HTH domain